MRLPLIEGRLRQQITRLKRGILIRSLRRSRIAEAIGVATVQEIAEAAIIAALEISSVAATQALAIMNVAAIKAQVTMSVVEIRALATSSANAMRVNAIISVVPPIVSGTGIAAHAILNAGVIQALATSSVAAWDPRLHATIEAAMFKLRTGGD